ncbi:hypothetical protein BGY98DRAFT_1181915 [Russula aff. rugulosa BPL654]|nr:hypothetical protein BGY98DRAFT_1181915 [Russula aff. rugulosa BPL654]
MAPISHMLCLHVPEAFALLFPFTLNPTIPNSSLPLMSHNHSFSTSSNFQLIFDNALKTYKKSTKNDLLKHPLADRLQACDSPSSILNVLQEQVQKLTSLNAATRRTIGEGVGLVSSPGKVIFIGFAVLLSTAKAVRADQDTLLRSSGAWKHFSDVWTYTLK